MAASKVMNLGIEVTLDSKGAVTGIKKIGRETELAGKKAAKSSQGVGKLNTALGALGVTMGAAGLLRAIGSVNRAFADFDQQITNVQNITGMADKEMSAFADSIRALPPELGGATDLTKGLYQALSAGIPKESVIQFIETNAKAAKGNLADLTQTIGASASIMNAFGLEGGEVNSVLDAMTKTVDLGVLTFSDLSNNLGKASGIASQAGLSYQELMAATAQLTKGGLGVEESITGIRAIMVAMLKPADDASEAMEEFGIDMSAARLKTDGLLPILQDLGRVVDGDAEKMARLVPNIRGLGPALTLAADGASGFASTLKDIEGASDGLGKVEQNFQRMSETAALKSEEMKAAFGRMQIAIGEELAPVMVQFYDAAIDFLPKVADAVSFLAEQMGYLGDSMEVVAVAASGLMTVLAASKIQAAATAATAAGTSFTVMGNAMAYAKTAAAPLSVSIAAIGAAAAVAIKTWDMLADQMRENADTDQEVIMALNQQTTSMTNALSKVNEYRESIGLARLSIEEWADRLGAVADPLDGVEAGILKVVRAQVMAGTATEEQRMIYDAFNGKMFEAADATDKLNDELAETPGAAGAQGKALASAAEKAELLEKAMENVNKILDIQSKWASEQEKVWDKFYDNVNDGASDWMFELQKQLDEGELSWDYFAEAVEALWSDLMLEKMTEPTEEWAEETRKQGQEAGEGLVEEVEQATDGLEIKPPEVDMEGPKTSIFDGITGGLSDALGKGFMGEWDSFSDLWDSLWQDAAKSMMGIIGDAFGDLLKDGNIGGFFESIQEEAGIGSTIGGIGMVMSAREQGGGQGALQGAMGGMMAGAIFGPIGMAVGAIAGGLMGFFGGKEDPRMSFGLGPGGASIYAARGQKMSDEEKRQWERNAASLYNNISDAYRGAFLAMGQGDLWDLVGAAPSLDTGRSVNSSTDIHMDDQAILAWLGDVKLPEMFESQYFDAFKQGLMNFGMNAETVQTLFEELGEMTGAERIQALTDFILTVRQVGEQLEAADWEGLKDQIGQDVISGYVEQMTDIGEEMDVLMGGWEDMDLLDVAREVGAVSSAFDGVTQATLQMLSAIENMRQGICDSLRWTRISRSHTWRTRSVSGWTLWARPPPSKISTWRTRT
jgi:TP901 family phage tail tape measure protein